MLEFPPISDIAQTYLSVAPASSRLEIDNSMVGSTLLIENACSSEYTVTFQREKIPFQKKGSSLEIPVVALLKIISPMETGSLVIKQGMLSRTIKITRKPLLSPQFSDLTPLYTQMARDIREKGRVIVTVPVVLWDASFTGAGRGSRWADGSDPETNLNWGNGSGIYHWLKGHAPGWELESEERQGISPIRTAVFKKEIGISSFWKKLGVEKPFNTYIVLLAYDSRDILEAYQYFGQLAQGSVEDYAFLSDNTPLPLSESRVVGMATHYIPEGRQVIPPDLKSDQPRGIFMASCFSSSAYGPRLVRENLFPLFFSTPKTSSEAFVYLPVIEGLLAGKSLSALLREASVSVAEYHRHGIPGTRQYNNPSTPYFEQSLTRYDQDWDQDSLPNDIDPEPNIVNPSKFDDLTQKIIVMLSNGSFIAIPAIHP